jgi:hypothetical protein
VDCLVAGAFYPTTFTALWMKYRADYFLFFDELMARATSLVSHFIMAFFY